ncbi:MAG: hypothetical protein IT371_26225 [Deltaproteobacteria bacterium]|nr:hypothetical protein [Deltaproteobacteria bacterium]
MSGTANRQTPRTNPRNLELATVYRDRRNLPYEQALERLEELAEVYTVFSVIGVVKDVSDGGLGLRFEGQQIMADNLLHPGERYILKLAFRASDVPNELGAYARREENYVNLLVKGSCRWYQRSATLSAAGFEISGDTPSDVTSFLREHFQLG